MFFFKLVYHERCPSDCHEILRLPFRKATVILSIVDLYQTSSLAAPIHWMAKSYGIAKQIDIHSFFLDAQQKKT